MPLVDYSESETDSSPGSGTESETGDGPSIPSLVLDSFIVGPRMDDPVFHDGRTRTQEHMEGTWPSHLYVEWRPTHIQIAALQSIVADIGEQTGVVVHSLVENRLKVAMPLHISLSSTVYIRTEDRHRFIEDNRRLVGEWMDQLGATHHLTVHLAGRVETWSNDDRTRHFVTLPVSERWQCIFNRLRQSSSGAGLSAEHVFHVSIGWARVPLGDYISHVPSGARRIRGAVKVKVGNEVVPF